MKRNSICYALFVIAMLCSSVVIAQPGYITTIAGNGGAGVIGDGGNATAAQIGEPMGVFVDVSGNVYTQDPTNNRIRKITPDGIINIFAGGSGAMSDGWPATDAYLNFSGNGVMRTDASGNMYIIDNHRLRKINASTGIVSTVAGSYTAGSSGDGGLAIYALLGSPIGICFDASGNVYFSDQNKIRKINTSGIISTFVGTGLSGPCGLCIDAAGNIYVADKNSCRILKISPTGSISIAAGTGASGFSGDGGPATAAKFNQPSQVSLDSYGNMYVADFGNNRVRKITPWGAISTIAGGGSDTMSGIPATNASFNGVWSIAVDGSDNIYVADRSHHKVFKVQSSTTAIAVSDSFSVFANDYCVGPEIVISSRRYGTGLNQTTYFGDGTSYSSAISPAYIGTSGMAVFSHNYSLPGTYTLKTIIRNGTTVLDSIIYSYQYKMCYSLQARFYIDNNNTLAYEEGIDLHSSLPILTEIDSNSIPVDTISATSGFYYSAYGAVGDIYTMKIIGSSSGMTITNPATGVISDTLQPLTYNLGVNNFGFNCSSTPGPDYRIYTANRCGSHRFDGDIIIDNFYCSATLATVTINTSPKYQFQHANPVPASVLGNTITWVLPALSAMSAPMHIKFSMERPSGTTPYMPGDTVNSLSIIGPFTGDLDTTNNTCHHTDTVKSGYDPNFIQVDPGGYVASGSQLQYTIGFENTGNDTAHNIYVLDTLSDDLDPATLTVVTASAAMDIYKFTAGGHTIVKFDFPHINLLDSSHHNECHGLVIYTIKTRTGLPDCRHITAEAGIYFDENPVVMTNMAEVIIGIPPAAATITGTTSVCISSTVSLTASVPGGTWSVSNTNASVSATGVVTGITAGMVFVYYTIPGVCQPITSQFLMTVGPPSAGSIASASSICLGSSIVLSSSVPGGTWLSANSNATISGNILTGAAIGTDTIYYTVITACGVAVTQQAITIDNPLTAAPLLGPASVCEGANITLTDAVAGGVWNDYYGHVSVSASGVVTGVSAGIDSVIYTVSNGCGWSSAKKGITVIPASACGSVSIGNDPVAGPSLNIYPNPANNELFIVTDEGAYRSLTITNNVGQVVLQRQITTTQTQLDIAPLSPGFYYITLTGNNGNVVRKFVNM